MNTVSTLMADIERFVGDLEQLVLEERGSQEQLNEQLTQLREEARFFNADSVVEALDEVSGALSRPSQEGRADSAALLPLLFRLRDAATDIGGDDRASEASTGGSFLEVDLQDEIATVLSISEEAERSLNSRMQAGQKPFLLVIRVDPAWMDAVEELLEAEYQILSYQRQERTARIAAVVVEVAPPEVQRAVDQRFGDRSIVKEASVRPLDPDTIRVRHDAGDTWYAGLSPIAVEIDPAAMERIWLLMDVLSPAGDDRMQPALWSELRRSIGSSFTVELRDVITDMQASLKEMAISAGKKIRLTVSGRGAAIGVEIAEPLRRVLFELISNAILHGIELPSERREQGKVETGSIACYVQSEGQSLSVRIGDDGRGFEHETSRRGKTGGLRRARDVVRDRLGGVLHIRSGENGVTAILDLPALQGIYRGLVVVRNDLRLVVPSALIVWAGEVLESRLVVDTTGARFLRYQRQLISLVEPEVRRPDTEEGAELSTQELDSRVSPEVPAVVIVEVAGRFIALAVDQVQAETVVSTSPDGWLRLSTGSDQWALGIALQNLPLGAPGART